MLVDTSVKLIAGGDVMLGRQFSGWIEYFGEARPFEGVMPALSQADVVMVNLETSVSLCGDFINKGERQPYYYHSRPEILDILTKAGISCVSMGNNHAMDFSATGLVQQTELLEASGFLIFGAGRSLDEAMRPKYIDVRGLRLAFIGFETEMPSMAATDEQPGVFHVPRDKVLSLLSGPITCAREIADVVIVSPHWGPNWVHAPLPQIQHAARGLIDLGADVILGHSSHVLQGVEVYRGRPIVYDMGTLLYDRAGKNGMDDSALFELALNPEGVSSLRVIPVKLQAGLVDLATGETARRITSQVQELSKQLNADITFGKSGDGLSLSLQPEARSASVKTSTEEGVQTLVAPCLPDYFRGLKSPLVLPSMPTDGRWEQSVRLNNWLEVLGARFASPVRPGRAFVCEVYFSATCPPTSGRMEARLTGRDASGKTVFLYTHPVADGVHPPKMWQSHEVICDRTVARPGVVLPEGEYTLYWHLFDMQNLVGIPAESVDERISNDQIRIGTLQVRSNAAKGVAGLDALTRLPMPQGEPWRAPWEADVQGYINQAVRPWLEDLAARRGVRLAQDDLTLVRNNPWGLVVQVNLGTDRCYFKALGHASWHEPAVLKALAKECPTLVQAPMVVDDSQHWMLLPHAGQTLHTLGEQQLQHHWTTIVRELAGLQLQTMKKTTQWLALGAPDLRLDRLPKRFAQLLLDEQLLQIGQTHGLTRQEQHTALTLLPRLQRCCQNLSTQPYSLGLDHGDFHLGNILVNKGHNVLIDWGGARVTHPFCVMFMPYITLIKSAANGIDDLSWIFQAYLQPWSEAVKRPVSELLMELYQAIWVAHCLRAINWTDYPAQQEKQESGPACLMVVKWIRRWIRSPSVFLEHNMTHTSSITGDVLPKISALASAANPLLLDIESIEKVTAGRWEGNPVTQPLSGLCFNRRYLTEGSMGNFYVPLNADADDPSFTQSNASSVKKAYAAGALAAIVTRDATDLPQGMPLLRVDNMMDAVEALGTYVRDKLYSGKRVVVTGTEGKTGFKCMLHHVLAPQISTHAVLNSSNYHSALHTSLASIRRDDKVTILEAAGGLAKQRSLIIKPHLFVITEVGNEHIDFHRSQQGVIEAKADICIGAVEGGFGILNADSRNYSALRSAVLARRRIPLLTFGSAPGCNGRLLAQKFDHGVWSVKADIEGQVVDYVVPLVGAYAPLASVSVLLSAYFLGADVAQAAAQLQNFVPYESQGVLRTIKVGLGGVLFYDNSTRASVLSFQAALTSASLMSAPRQGGKKVGVIGQMIFLGKVATIEHQKLAEWVERAGFDTLILVGKLACESLFGALTHPEKVIHRFADYDRRTSSPQDLRKIAAAIEGEIQSGDFLFIKGELDELGDYFRKLEVSSPNQATIPLIQRQSVDTTKPTEPDLALPESLKDLRHIQPEDLFAYRAAIDKTQRMGWQNYFPFMYFLGQNSHTQFLWQIDEGSICIYRLRGKPDKQDLCLFALPLPFNPDVLQRCIKRVRAFNNTQRASIFRVDEGDAALFKDWRNTRIVTCPSEYIYAPERYRDLSGKAHRNLRRSVNQTLARENLLVSDYQIEDAQECLAVHEQWIKQQSNKYESILFQSYTRACLLQADRFPRPDLFGKVIRLNGQIRSFGFAGEMRAGVGNLYITYSDHTVDGLNKFLIYTLLREMDQLALVNSGNAADAPGLAVAKQALGPVAMHTPSQVYAFPQG